MAAPIRWFILGGIPVLLSLCFVLLVPFRQWEYVIDRQNGRWSTTVIWYGVLRTAPGIPYSTWSDPAIPALFTAPSRPIACIQRSQRFPWSIPLETQTDPEVWYAEAFHQLFFAMQRPTVKLTAAERDALVRARIPSWNAPGLDRDPQAVAEAARAENRRIFGVDTPYMHIRTP